MPARARPRRTSRTASPGRRLTARRRSISASERTARPQSPSYGAVGGAAAGNGNPEGTPVATPSYPAACPGAIGVAATDSSDEPASFSNYGAPDVDVSAPGVDVLSTLPDDSYAFEPGTSMASPFVTALAALIR